MKVCPNCQTWNLLDNLTCKQCGTELSPMEGVQESSADRDGDPRAEMLAVARRRFIAAGVRQHKVMHDEGENPRS